MANPEHLKILKQGVEQWNKWRDEHSDLVPDLRGVDLSNAQLAGANFRGANLRGANLETACLDEADLRNADLSEANLCGADLRDAALSGANIWGSDLIEADLCRADLSQANVDFADLTGADLSGADLDNADLNGTDLRRTNLTGANLSWADLRDADLSETNFSGAGALGTVFSDVDLSQSEGLQTITHEAPSTIGIDTIYKSRGKIPEVFLRGCGVPDEFIDFIRSMTKRAIEFYSCFISHSTKDQEFADRLYADLQNKGGRKLHEQLDEAIRLHDKLLLILSEHSMNSPWVKTEIADARKREEREKKQMLFPITLAPFADVKRWELFDADRGIDSAREIREYFIPDFSNWKDHDSYQTAFQRLVKDLKAETKSAAG